MRRLPSSLGLALAALLGAAPAAAFDIAECDGDNTLGDAGILLGWPEPTATSIGTVLVDDQGAANSGITTADANADWQAAIGLWTGISGTSLGFPSTTSSTITSEVLQGTLSANDSRRGWLIVQPTTKISGSPGGQGWEHLTSTDACGFLGLTYTVFDTGSRRLLDADILLNDDGPDPGDDADCLAAGRADFYSRTATGGTPTTGKFDLQGLMAHEIGHFLGSDHSIQSGALMEASAPTGTNLSISDDDRKLLRFLYSTTSDPAGPDRNDTSLTACSDDAATPTQSSRGGSSGGGCVAGEPTGAGVGLLPLLAGALAALRWRRRRRPRS